MAVKQTNKKSRTLKQKPSFKLKWWYVIPVVLLVAATGILILRFSDASSRTSRRFAGNGLSGGYATEGRGADQRRLIRPGVGVSATLGSKALSTTQTINNKYVCVRVFVDGGADRYWNFNIDVARNFPGIGRIAFTDAGPTSLNATTRGWATRCLKIQKNPGSGGVLATYADVNVNTSNGNSKVGVNEIWLQSDDGSTNDTSAKAPTTPAAPAPAPAPNPASKQ
jgi:hypothetical protein